MKMIPEFFASMKGYSKEQAIRDVVAGVIVAIIALPLSIALALASGVGPEQGLYTAIVAGFLISFFGGSRVQIAGPTAAFATIVAGIVATKGMDGLATATVMAGAMMIVLGLCRAGSLIKYIPQTITTGFTSGIAVTIVVGQLKDFFGVTYPAGLKPVETMEKMEALFANFGTVNWVAVGVGLLCLGILIAWNYVPAKWQKIPGSLIAVIVGILTVMGLKAAGLHVNTIGDLYTITPGLPKLTVPHFSGELMLQLIPDAFTIAVLAGIESLLSCVVADSMIGTRHQSNMELMAQGIGNIGSALFGGIPATGAIARTAANIKNGGRTPVAGMVHAVVLLLVLVLLMPYAALIPMPCIAAILFMVAYNMCQWRQFVALCKKAPWHDIVVLVVTFVLTVVFDLVIAIAVGLAAFCVMMLLHNIRYQQKVAEEEAELADTVKVATVKNNLLFGPATGIQQVHTPLTEKVLVVDLKHVHAMDISGIHALDNLATRCQKKGVTMMLSGVHERNATIIRKAGLEKKLGQENICKNLVACLEQAEKLVK